MPEAIRQDDPRSFTWADGRAALAGTLIVKTSATDAIPSDPDKIEDVEFVMSDATPDRVGDVIEPGGWKLAQFKRNPMALFGHSSRDIIGGWRNVRVEGERLIGVLRLAKAGTSAIVDEVRSLIAQKLLRAVSVGFRPLEWEPLDPEKPWAGFRFLKSELLECSIVAVPANANALRVKSTIPANMRALLAKSGETGALVISRDLTTARSGAQPIQRRGQTMPMTLAERIAEQQTAIINLKDQISPLAKRISDGEELEADEETTFETLNGELAAGEKTLARLRSAEHALAARTSVALPPAGPAPGAPAIIRAGALAQNDRPMNHLVRLALCHIVGHATRTAPEAVMQLRYRERDDLAAIIKAVTNPATTTTAGWAAELVQTALGDLMEQLRPISVYGALKPRGASFTFGRAGRLSIPARAGGGTNAPGDLRGSFVGEGRPIPVRRGQFGAAVLLPHKMGVISTYTREIAQHSTPAIEALIRDGMIADTAIAIDTALLDNVAGDSIRPAGLLNGVTPTAGAAGGDQAAMEKDFQALIAPFITANAASGIVILINPAKLFKMSWVVTPLGTYPFREQINAGNIAGYSYISSTNVPLNTLIALQGESFATATGDQPEFDISDVATIHEDDGAYPVTQAIPLAGPPLPIATGAPGAAVVATPIRSLWQTASIGVRMLLDITWAMRRAGMVSAVTGLTW